MTASSSSVKYLVGHPGRGQPRKGMGDDAVNRGTAQEGERRDGVSLNCH